MSSKPEAQALPSQDAETEAPADKESGPVAAKDGTPPSPSETAQPTQDDDPNAPDPSEGELRKLRPETRRRFERLLKQRNEARQSLEQVQPELTQHRQLRGYLDQHQLAPDDVNMLLQIGASLRRQDYKSFLTAVSPYVQLAQEAEGIRYAPDLQKQVDDGLINEETARELTRTRHRAVQAEHRLQQQVKVSTNAQADQNLAGIRQAVDQWEANIRTRDPDYADHKWNAVRRYSQALMQERGMPASPEQAVALIQAAYDEASRELARLKPQLQPTRNVPSGVHSSTNGTGGMRAPSTMKEAALQALANMRRAS